MLVQKYTRNFFHFRGHNICCMRSYHSSMALYFVFLPPHFAIVFVRNIHIQIIQQRHCPTSLDYLILKVNEHHWHTHSTFQQYYSFYSTHNKKNYKIYLKMLQRFGPYLQRFSSVRFMGML